MESTSNNPEMSTQKFNPGKGYDLIRDGFGLEYVEIRYDISGNYFRLQKGKFVGERFLKFISENKQYVTGKEIL